MMDFAAPLAQLLGVAESLILQVALVFVRVGAAVSLLPGLGEQMVPQRIRLAVALALTAIVVPAVPAPTGTGFGALAIEAAAGLVLGVGLRLMILGLQTAGTIAAQSISLAQMFNGTGPEPQPIVANLFTLAGIVLFLAMGGLVRSVELLVLSYELMPPGQIPDASLLSQWGLDRVAMVFALGFSLAAPFVLAALLYNLALGVMNRAMPQLMVALIGAPALTLGGLALLALASPALLAIWLDAMRQAMALPYGG
ncbi:flagellar biosynthetic protein FliR [Rhodobacter sp. Har01]|uniref:flagellar biosynthetic protein FliR n=1 Tax=Rhodobacter sp. Har01 TaxID=2883999 RepID=UPI001D06DB27|nr:flagellar biosynthetic protein FliR [Rhodobacter sp. Har01]MCB6177939.1 flagellar biosynthetic protein FliR [Rhodobacter sp. Har01]